MEPTRPRIEPSLAPPADVPPADLRPSAPERPGRPEPPVPHRHRRSWGARTRRALLWMFLVLVLLGLVPPGAVLWLRWNAPPTSAFMLRSDVKPVAYQWVSRERIPESLRHAVIAAEDQKFWTHWGFDFIAIAEALEHNEKNRRKRGASTISQQTAKNLFLWPSRSWLRKGLEVSFTLLLEGLWPKERILEVYLNIAEFGPGVYGVEAAARKFFDKPADRLTAVETAQLAAVLPNPRKWRVDRPGPYVQSRVDWILIHTGHAPRFSAPPLVPAAEPPDAPGGELAEDETLETPLGESPEPPAGEQTVIEGEPAPEGTPAEPEPETGPSAEPAVPPEQSPSADPAAPAPETPRYTP